MRRPTLTEHQVEERASAYRAVRRAIRVGMLVPQPCEHCGNTDSDRSSAAHHYQGYSPEHQLTVMWLCDQCHASAHTRDGLRRVWPMTPAEQKIFDVWCDNLSQPTAKIAE